MPFVDATGASAILDFVDLCHGHCHRHRHGTVVALVAPRPQPRATLERRGPADRDDIRFVADLDAALAR